MIRIQRFGLLADIQRRVRVKGTATVSWKDLQAFAAPLRIKPLAEALVEWAQANAMSLKFAYDSNGELRIASATFHAAS